MTSRRDWRLATVGVFGLALLATVPTIADFGMTFDEPAYRFCQQLSGQWWERLVRVRSAAELSDVLAADSLLYYWPYARFGINFHPPFAGQLNLLTWEAFEPFLGDIASRRVAQSVQLALACAVLFHFLGRRYGALTGLAAAGSLVLMPRVYAQAHLIETDVPGMLLWLLAAVAFWNGQSPSEPGGRRWRIALGVLAGLAFVEKMAAVLVLVPLLFWLAASRLPGVLRRLRDDPGALRDALLTTFLLAAPLALAYAEIRRLTTKLPPPQYANLFYHDPPSLLPGGILLVPLGVWLVRHALRLLRPHSPIWGPERPALEIVHALLGFAPAVAWLGNPAWWRHSLVRLAHYYQITSARRGALPDIQNLYFGRIYEFTLPWPSSWVLLALSTPPVILLGALVGTLWGLGRLRRGEGLPLFALLLFATMPLTRFAETPAHDGVRLLMPCFPFLAMLAGWGLAGIARWAAQAIPAARPRLAAATAWAVLLVLLLPAAWASWTIHPYGLSYFNRLIGGPAGAWRSGFELSYWYDAFTPEVLDDINRIIPPGSAISYSHDQSNPAMILQDLQATGALRGDLHHWDPNVELTFPYILFLTHDSKATSFTRLLFAMRPWYASTPEQLGHQRVVSIVHPDAVSRTWALQLLGHGPAAAVEPADPPDWVVRYLPALGHLWVRPVERPTADTRALEWARSDPASLRQAAREVVAWARSARVDLGASAPFPPGSPASRLLALLRRDDRPISPFSYFLLSIRPEAVLEAVEILINRPDEVLDVLQFVHYREPLRGYLDRDLPPSPPPADQAHAPTTPAP